ncbi:MAG: hypothetical protein U0795_26955 [Pirellulales bacterium]
MTDNPYAPPTSPALLETKKNPWRLIPAIFLGVFGLITAGVGIAILGSAVFLVGKHALDPVGRSVLVTELPRVTLMMTLPVLMIICGSCWLYASSASWKQNWRRAILMAVIGLIAALVCQYMAPIVWQL